MEQIWNAILELTAQFVTPDWGAVVALIPFSILGLVVLYLGWLLWRAGSLGPRRRGKGRVRPRPPEGVHAPHGSFAPIFAAIGTALVLFGLVFGPVTIVLGVSFLLLTLLYWGRESMREYDHLAGRASSLPAVVRSGPPPGIHSPIPSFRPILGAIAVAVVFYGLVFGAWLVAMGLIMLVISLVGWLHDARLEYVLAERADASGHLESPPAPRVPTATLALFGVLFVIGVLLSSGLVPPPKATSGGAAGSPGTSPPAGGAAPPSLPVTDVTISAKRIAYTTAAVDAPAGKAFTIAFVNLDAGVPHNVSIHRDSPSGQEVFKGEIFNGVATRVYDVPALDAGSYAFVCSVHPNMTGTLTVK